MGCKLHLLLIWLQLSPLGLRHQTQEVLVALFGHDGIPRGIAEFSDLGSGQVACPARDRGLVQRFLLIFAFCKEIARVLRVSEKHMGRTPKLPGFKNSYIPGTSKPHLGPHCVPASLLISPFLLSAAALEADTTVTSTCYFYGKS